MQIVSNIALISINETLIVQLISFLIFLYIMNRIMFRPLRSIRSERDTYMEKIKLEIADAQMELQNLNSQIKEQESAVKDSAFMLKKELEESGSLEANEIFASTRKEIEAIKESTQKQVDTQVANARKYIQEEAEALAANIMERVLDRRLNR